jgi:two-component system cell cycle response regulator
METFNTDIENINYGKELMLVVDDEEFVRDPIVEMLTHLGFKVKAANNGKDALKELRKNDYTFVLTDIKMPEMGGLELIRHIRNEFPNIFTIAMTAYSTEYKYIDVVIAGATDFINKPFNIEELEAKIRRGIIERNIKQELNRLSITDSLTGLYNQRHFYSRLEQEMMRAQRQKSKLSLILLDLNDFKIYNDTHGHLAGDKILQKVGKIIRTHIRQKVDSGFRYGGDEFAVILIDADESIGREIGERIEKAIENECKIGVSLGYAEYSRGMNPEQFVDTADKHLYKFKGSKKLNQSAH